MVNSHFFILYHFIFIDKLLKPEGTKSFDPAHKFSLIWDVTISNVNYFTEKASLDAAIDESSWFDSCQGPFVQRILKGKKIPCGGQSTLLCDVGTYFPRAVIHRHSSNPKYEGFDQGSSEVKMLVDNYILPQVGPNKLWTEKPHLTFDNFFFKERVSRYLGNVGIPHTCTCARNKLPFQLDNKFFHKEKGQRVGMKAARYLPPIVFVKEEDNYRMVLFSFQSTGTTNIMCVNSVSDGRFYVKRKERGRKDNKYVRLIEMNMGRELYLLTYGAVDNLDALIEMCKVSFINQSLFVASLFYFVLLTHILKRLPFVLGSTTTIQHAMDSQWLQVMLLLFIGCVPEEKWIQGGRLKRKELWILENSKPNSPDK